jgi:hypothetical protein
MVDDLVSLEQSVSHVGEDQAHLFQIFFADDAHQALGHSYHVDESSLLEVMIISLGGVVEMTALLQYTNQVVVNAEHKGLPVQNQVELFPLTAAADNHIIFHEGLDVHELEDGCHHWFVNHAPFVLENNRLLDGFLELRKQDVILDLTRQ